MQKKMRNKIGFYLLSFTWGFPMTIVGLVVAIVLIIMGHKPTTLHHRMHFKVGKRWGGVSLGTVIITDQNPTNHTLKHELGHTVQNVWFGPLFPLLVGVPSVIRYWYRKLLIRSGQSDLPPYDAIWFEGQASELGNKYFTIQND